METLEKSLVCRLCGKHCQISVNIFDKNENHVWKINVILPITVHEMDFLPKQMCHRCSYKLEEFYNFYAECVKTDTDLKNQLSWMRKETSEEQIITPMVKMNPFKIKTEPPDCNDSNSSDVFGHISSYGSYASPILTCSRCRCLCNTSVKVSESPTEAKAFSKGIGKPHNSNVNNNNLCDKNGESSKPDEVNKSCQINELNDNDCSGENIVIEKEVNTKEKIPLVIIDSSEWDSLQDPSDATNRALRPRKSSIDYIGPKKKVYKLKERFKSKVEICPATEDPVEVKTTMNLSRHSHPIVKLEKLDDSLKNLRARKNLEEFNKKIKELAHARRLLSDEQIKNKFIRRLENRSRKSFHKDETLKKKSLLKEEKLKRKSLQFEKSQSVKNFIDESRKNLQSEKNLGKKMLTDHQSSEVSQLNKNQNKKRSKNEKLKGLEVSLENLRDRQCSTNDILQINANDGSTQNADIQVKQEIVKVKTANSNILEDQPMVQEKSCEIIAVKNTSSSLHRLPKYPMVKLEKDYTCNVDYPRVKIKRHLTVADPTKLVNGAPDCSVESKILSEDDKTNKKHLTGKKKILHPENSKRKKKKFKGVLNSEKAGKVSKKKSKGLSVVHVKKGTSAIPSTEFKHFCEECDMCFKNRELFKLHPCYQK